MTYFTLRQPHQVEYEIKRSRFIAIANSATTRSEAMLRLQNLKTTFPDARHHCWAYLLGSPFQPTSMAMSDDGEPANTAGKPILNVLQHHDIGNIMVVVVRYFGGVKLGAGGLVRAYSQASQQLIDSVTKDPFVSTVILHINCEFSQEQYVRHICQQHSGHVLDCTYTSVVSILLECPEKVQSEICDILTRQQISVRKAPTSEKS